MRLTPDSPLQPKREALIEVAATPASPVDGSRRRSLTVRQFCTRWSYCILAFLLISVYLSHRHFGQYFPLRRPYSHSVAQTTVPIPIPVAANRTQTDEVGIVLLGLGPFARQLKCEGAVESLRRHGGWDGPIYLLTDAPRCFNESEIWTPCGIDAVIIDVHDDLSSAFAMPSLYKTRGNRLESKKYKTRIFDLVPDGADVLLYMDCDILVAGVEHGLQEFVMRYKNDFDHQTQILLFPENNPSQLNGVVHTGIFVAHRTWSAELLNRWAVQLDTDLDASDQAAFVRAGIEAYAFMEEKRYLYRPHCDLVDCSTQSPRLFNHINGARCWKQGKSEIQRFVNRWELCTYQKHSYCYPWYRAHLAMGWVPNTSCQKLEEERSD